MFRQPRTNPTFVTLAVAVTLWLAGCVDSPIEPTSGPSATATQFAKSLQALLSLGNGHFLYPCFLGGTGVSGTQSLWVPVPVATHLAAAGGLVDLVHTESFPDGGEVTLYCTVPKQPGAIAAARAHFGRPFKVFPICGSKGACEGAVAKSVLGVELSRVEICTDAAQCGGDVTAASVAVREDPPPEEEEPEPDEPSDPPPDDGSGGTGSGPTAVWDPYFDHEEGDNQQVRQACDTPPGQAYGGQWYTCIVRAERARDEHLESMMRANESALAFCGQIANMWRGKYQANLVGWWRETVPRPAGYQTGHYHGEGGVGPIGHLHLFEGNSQYPLTWQDWLRTAVHETLHAMGYNHDDIITGGLTYREVNAICSASDGRM